MPPSAARTTPSVSAHGAGERPADVPEELALEQGLADAGAVDGDERALPAPGAVVDAAGEQFLAGAAFAFQQHDAVVGGDGVGDGHDLAERGTGTDQRLSGDQSPARAVSGRHASSEVSPPNIILKLFRADQQM